MLRAGLTLVIIGIFLPVGTLPLTKGYLPKVGFIYNLQGIELRITDDTLTPKYADGESSGYGRILVEMPQGCTIDFPDEDTMKKALARKYIEKTKQIDVEQNRGKSFYFDGWDLVKKGLTVPYKIIFSFSVLLLGAGLLIVTLSWRKKCT